MQNNKLQIGNLILDNPFLLAPLAGITDAPTRRLCHRMGAALVYSEMISAKALYYGDKKTERLLEIFPDEKPMAIQIFGHEPEIMAFAAQKLEQRENALLDINMGCPVPKVVKNGEGSALLKKPELIYDIVKAVASATKKPVTCKIRMGFDNKSINAIEVAKAIEEAGASAVAVHGRTREQYYQGKSERKIIRDVKQTVKIPVIGNGDVFSGEDGIRLMDETGCDFVMVARGMLGNPWIFKELISAWKGDSIPEHPSLYEKKIVIINHFCDMIKCKGEFAAVREMRKHVGWYFKGVPGSATFRAKVNQIDNAKDLKEAIEKFGE